MKRAWTRRALLHAGLRMGVAGMTLGACGPTGVLDDGTGSGGGYPTDDPTFDPTLPPENPSGMPASEYWQSIGGDGRVDLSMIVAGSEDNSVAPFLHWLHDRMERPTPGGSIGMIPDVAQTYVDRFGRFGNISDQAMIVLSEYFAQRDVLAQTPDERSDSGETFIHPDTYVSGWDVGVWMPHNGQDIWFPVASIEQSDPQRTGLPPNEKLLGIRYTDLDSTPNESRLEQDAIENWLSLLGYDRCSWNATQDWPENSPGFSLVVDKDHADSLPGGVPLYNPFPWPLVVQEDRSFSPTNGVLFMRADQIDRAVWDAEFHWYNVSHLAAPSETYRGWEYSDETGLPVPGQVIPPFTNGSRTVISSLSKDLSSRFADARIYAAPSFGESRKSAGGEYPDHHIVSPFDVTLSPGKRVLAADGGLIRRPVPDSGDPSTIVGWDYRAVAPCAYSPDGIIEQPDSIRYN